MTQVITNFKQPRIINKKAKKQYAIEHPYCEICGNLACDVNHIVPKSRGGDDIPDNFISTCRLDHAIFHGVRIINGRMKWRSSRLGYEKRIEKLEERLKASGMWSQMSQDKWKLIQGVMLDGCV